MSATTVVQYLLTERLRDKEIAKKKKKKEKKKKKKMKSLRERERECVK